MYPVSNKYKHEILRSGRQTRSYVVIDNVKYDSTNNLKSYPKIENNASKLFGGFPTKSYEINLINYDNVLDLKDKEIQTYMGLKYFDEDIVKEGENIDVDLDYGMKSKLEISGAIYQDTTLILPEEYTQLDYIEGTGSQYIDLGYPFGTTSKVEISIDVERSNLDGLNRGLFGARINPETESYSIIGNLSWNNNIRWDICHGDLSSKKETGQLLEGNNIVIKDGFKNYLNGVDLGDNNTEIEDFEPAYNSYLLAINTIDKADLVMSGKIRYFKGWVDGVETYNCLPAKRISDGAIGLYNLVDGTFFASASTTAFVAGNELTIPNLNDAREVRACGDNVQLFDKDNCTIINATYNYDTAQIASNNNARSTYIKCEPNKTYTISKIAGQRFIVGTTTDVPALSVTVNSYKGNSTGTSITIETGENDNYIWVYYYLSTADTLTPKEILDSIKICKGTSTGGYSKYGQGSISFKKSNKNIYQLSEEEISFTVSGVTFTAKNNKLTINGTSTATIERTSFKNKFEKIKLNGKYYLSEKHSETLPSGCYTGVSYTSNYYNSIGKGLLDVNNEFAVSLYIPSGKTFENYTIEYQIEEGTVGTEIIPHEGNEYIVPTQQPFYKGDTFVKIAGKWYEQHNYSKHIFTGNEDTWNMTYGTSLFNIRGIFTENPPKAGTAYSNMFKYNTVQSGIDAATVDGEFAMQVSTYSFFFKDTNYTDVSLWKAKLQELYNAGTPLYIVYPLATPILIECTEEQNAILDELDNLFLYDGVNHIYSEDEVEPNLKMTISGTEYIPQGTCIVQEINDSKTKRDITIKGNDYAIKFNADYDSSQFEFPMTYTEFIDKICNICDVRAKNTEDLHFANTILNEQPNFNETETKYRQIINWIAEANLCIAIIGKDDQLQFVTRYKTDINIDKYYHTNLSVNHKFGPINSLVISRLDTGDGTTTEDIYTKDDESIAANGLQEYKIIDNPFLYYNREEVIEELFNLIKGQEWYDFSCKYNGHPELDINDVIGVTDRFENTIYTPILNLTIDNRVAGSLKNEINIENKTKYSFAGGTAKRIKKVEYEVDKANGEIRSLIEKQTDTTKKLTEVEQTVDGISQSVSAVEEKVETVESTANTASNKADSAITTANNTQAVIDNLEVGGRNLLLDSAFPVGTVKWNNYKPDTEVTYKGKNSIKITGGTSKRLDVPVAYYSDYIPGKSLVLRFYMMCPDITKITATINSWIGFRTEDGTPNGATQLLINASDLENNVWKEFIIKAKNTIETNVHCTMMIQPNNADAILYVACPKLEYGNTPTDWTPAPEDVDSDIANAQAAADNAQSTADNINDNLTTNYYTKTETNSQIKSTADSITTSVSKEISTAKTEAIEDANSNTDEKLKDYSTTSQMNSIIEQTANEINQKIEQIEDITNSIEGTNAITLENCVEGDLLELHIYGNNTVFEYLYPSDTLYPSDDLYPYGDSRIVVTNEDGNETVYELGVLEVLRQNSEVCDEFVLEKGQAKVIRRVDTSGTIKATPTTEDLGEYSIKLKEGTNTITIQNYTAKLSAKFAIKNTYTEVFATKVEMQSSITQTAEEINLEVKKKVDANEVISSINQSAEAVGIDANKIKLSANDILNLLAGNTINLSSKNITISSDNFKVNKNGVIEAIGAILKDATINGGHIKFSLETGQEISIGSTGIVMYANGGSREITIYCHDEGDVSIALIDENGETHIAPNGIITPTVTQTSLESQKKNFEKLQNGLDIVKATEIYKYNLKSQTDGDKKHIGFVIGKNYKYSKEITALDKDGKEVGIDSYSMIAAAYKAIQEQQEIIEQLQIKLKELEEK